jgi:hypothetical protein
MRPFFGPIARESCVAVYHGREMAHSEPVSPAGKAKKFGAVMNRPEFNLAAAIA